MNGLQSRGRISAPSGREDVNGDLVMVFCDLLCLFENGSQGLIDNESMETLLRPIVDRVDELLEGLDVLEIACGTGNWTQVLSRRAKRVLAVDASGQALELAKAKTYGPAEVTFRIGDAYSLGHVGQGFTGAFASDWWSHVPRSLLTAFLSGVNSRLSDGARVAFVDMLPRDHPDLEPYRHDSEGNAICRRTLPDGRSFDVVKNFPDRHEVLDSVSAIGESPEYWEWSDLRRWMVAYRVAAERSGT